jgi:hypothetical protein
MSLSVNVLNPVATLPIEFLRSPSSIIPANNTTPADSSPPAAGPAESTSGGSVSVSQQGQFLSDLQNLQDTQPQKAQAALSQAAGGLSAAAQQAGPGTPQGQFLAAAAVQFQQVATSGSISSLQPAPAASAVERAYRPNEIGGGQGALALLSTRAQTSAAVASPATSSTAGASSSSSRSSSGQTPVLTIPDLFAQSSETSSTGSSVLQSVNEVIKQLQKTLSS